ncbi:MAG: N-acetyl-gamma-glutamyl-phosphate reductase [Candidatus Hydrogenedentes bacterium]|nr:N-acetyl-gamma-glutamyl-phosphate reductase [Candidatus Hydrogenedentota bacterium]
MIKVGIIGATGYGGRELLRLLLPHSGAAVVSVTSTSAVGQRLDAQLPAFRSLTDLVFTKFDAEALAASCDVVFIGVPGNESMAPVQALRAAGVRVIDIGSDFRLKDTALFKQYYKAEHTASELLDEAVYGYVPGWRGQLSSANLVAVPGCYPISIITPLRPLLNAPLDGLPIVVNSVSGISGAGRTPSPAFHFPEMNENYKAYKVGVHQHIPEIEQALDFKMTVQYTPHVTAMTRGIHTTIVLRPSEPFDPATYYDTYKDEPFVRVLGEGVLPEVQYVRGTNFVDFGWVQDARTGNIVIACAIDNLMGGTAGMAVQCMNLMFGLDETTGLMNGAFAP